MSSSTSFFSDYSAMPYNPLTPYRPSIFGYRLPRGALRTFDKIDSNLLERFRYEVTQEIKRRSRSNTRIEFIYVTEMMAVGINERAPIEWYADFESCPKLSGRKVSRGIVGELFGIPLFTDINKDIDLRQVADRDAIGYAFDNGFVSSQMRAVLDDEVDIWKCVETHAVFCKDKHLGIGLNGDMPWTVKEDLQLFRKITRGHALIQGANTARAFKGRTFQDRVHITLTSNTPPWGTDFVPVCNATDFFAASIEDALVQCMGLGLNAFFIGGKRVIEECLPRVNYWHLSELMGDYETDVKLDEQILVKQAGNRKRLHIERIKTTAETEPHGEFWYSVYGRELKHNERW